MMKGKDRFHSMSVSINVYSRSMCKSAWGRGVREYALELAEKACEMEGLPITEEALLDGAQDWKQYSYGGCSLIYDMDIAQRVCSPSELKKYTLKSGRINRGPNRFESWLDVQARALSQASQMVMQAVVQELHMDAFVAAVSVMYKEAEEQEAAQEGVDSEVCACF